MNWDTVKKLVEDARSIEKEQDVYKRQSLPKPGISTFLFLNIEAAL